MGGIWYEEGGKWQTLPPTPFNDEKALHDLVEKAPELLPLSGSPALTMLGREVWLPDVSGAMDLLAIEDSGTPVVIEVKLRANPESKRAIVAQVLAYAAALHRVSPDDFVAVARAQSLEDLWVKVATSNPRAIDQRAFIATLEDSLRAGRFRLVIVLDQVPKELVRLIGFLEQATQSLVIDLVTVSSHSVAGQLIVVPQRVEPERDFVREREQPDVKGPESKPSYSTGCETFDAAIATAKPEVQGALQEFSRWTRELVERGEAKAVSAQGNTFTTLKPIISGDDASAVSAWIGPGAPFAIHRTVVARIAQGVLEQLDHELGLGETAKNSVSIGPAAMTPRVYELLTAVYVNGRMDQP